MAIRVIQMAGITSNTPPQLPVTAAPIPPTEQMTAPRPNQVRAKPLIVMARSEQQPPESRAFGLPLTHPGGRMTAALECRVAAFCPDDPCYSDISGNILLWRRRKRRTGECLRRSLRLVCGSLGSRVQAGVTNCPALTIGRCLAFRARSGMTRARCSSRSIFLSSLGVCGSENERKPHTSGRSPHRTTCTDRSRGGSGSEA
jgi:hypothetical protein